MKISVCEAVAETATNAHRAMMLQSGMTTCNAGTPVRWPIAVAGISTSAATAAVTNWS